jgi:hypothetical protein
VDGSDADSPGHPARRTGYVKVKRFAHRSVNVDAIIRELMGLPAGRVAALVA